MFARVERSAGQLAWLGLGLAWWLASSSVQAGEPIADRERGFTWSVPDGFRPAPQVIQQNPKIIHAFSYSDPGSERPVMVLYMTKLGGVLGRERLSMAKMSPGFKGTVLSMRWRDFEVDAVEVPEAGGTITFNAQVPLKREAVQVSMVGPSGRRAELLSYLQASLDGLTGESNWTASGGVSSTGGSRAYQVGVLIGCGLAFVTGLLIMWLASRKLPGISLLLAVLLFCASSGNIGPKGLESAAATVCLRLLGVAGIILGIVDLVRRPRKKPAAQPAADLNEKADSPPKP